MMHTPSRRSRRSRRSHTLRAALLLSTLIAPLGLIACQSDRPLPRNANFISLTRELESFEAATLDQTWQATLTAMDRLGFIVTQKDRTDLEARLLARTQGGRDVRIRVSRETTVISSVRIRVDLLGDETLSRVILQQIQATLPGLNTLAAPLPSRP